MRSGGDLVQLAAVQAPRPWLQYIPPPNSKHSRPCWPPGSAGPRSARGWACGDPCCAGWFIASSARASCCRVQGQGQSRRPSRRRSRCRPSHSNCSLPPPHHCSNWTTMPADGRSPAKVAPRCSAAPVAAAAGTRRIVGIMRRAALRSRRRECSSGRGRWCGQPSVRAIHNCSGCGLDLHRVSQGIEEAGLRSRVYPRMSGSNRLSLTSFGRHGARIAQRATRRAIESSRMKRK